MKQFRTIFGFELTNYLKNKVFVGVTIFLVALIAVVMFFPRISAAFDKEEPASESERPVMLVAGGCAEEAQPAFAAAFPSYTVQVAQPMDAKEQVSRGAAECAFVINRLDSYEYYVENLTLYDQNTMVADEVLQTLYRRSAMVGSGMSEQKADGILSVQIAHETQKLGKDQMQTFFYTYVMIFALYMVILLYGQMVATNVATEKSSRAMEVLITSAKPTAMMFGKVLASCLAGLVQLVCIFGAAFVCFQLNRGYWADNEIVCSIFDMPLDLLGYMLVFFVLGFLIYAFLYGAIGSTASKLEDINTSVMPITLVFILSFLVVMLSMSSGNVDNTAMQICSFIPFTSPMAMFTRIAMSVVPTWQILLSIGILAGSAVGIGVLAAKIYRVGVLMYGNRPKLGAIVKAVWKA